MAISNLQGSTQLSYRGRLEPVQLGVTAYVPIDRVLFPLQAPVLREALSQELRNAIFTRGSAVLGELPLDVDAPPMLSPSEVALYNTLAGEWTVDTQVTFLEGLYQEGEAITPGLANDVVDSCEWRGAWLLADDYSTPFLVLQDTDGHTIKVNAYYPDVVFPDLMQREDGIEDRYTGTAIDRNGTLYEHTIWFEDATTLSWSLDVDILGDGLCRVARIEGRGNRIPQTAGAAEQAQMSATTWRAQLIPDVGTVPANEPIQDCPDAASYTPPTDITIVGTTLNNGDNLLTLEGNIDGLPFPTELTNTPITPDSYIGVALTDTEQIFHEVRFDGELLNWRIMIRSLSEGCRVGTIQAVGSPMIGE